MGSYGVFCTLLVLSCTADMYSLVLETCDPIDNKCQLSCDYGYKRVNGCPVCECAVQICQDVTCLQGKECRAYTLASGHAISRCVDPNLPEECHAPMERGPCTESSSRVFYNSEIDQCEDFIYGGCSGNDNNFASMEACQATCMPADQFQVAPACGPFMCLMTCEHGFKKDTNGCDICECETEPKCSDFICTRYCNEGFQKDANGCDICVCKEEPKCSEVKCARYCEFGFKKDENGCDVCDCEENPKCNQVMCAKYCENGFEKDEKGCDVCKCKCPEVMCTRHCLYGFKKDASSCDVCDCQEHTTCPEVMCSRFCEYGFEKDEQGCDVCRCRTERYQCPRPMCRMQCEFGFEVDSNSCKKCSCANNPCQASICPTTSVCQAISQKNCTLCAMQPHCIPANSVQRIMVQLHFVHSELTEIDVDDFESAIKVHISYMLTSRPEYIRGMQVMLLDQSTTGVIFHVVSYGYWDLVSAYDKFHMEIKTHHLGTAFKYEDVVFIPEHKTLSVRYYQNPEMEPGDEDGEESEAVSTSSVDVGLIIGCTIAGVVGLLIMILVIVFLCRPKKSDRPNVAYVRAPEPKLERIVTEKPQIA